MVSKTDKTRPYRVAKDDPYNRKFMTGEGKWGPWWWKKITSCHDSHCCGKDSPWRKKETRRRRYQWKREVRKHKDS